MKKTNIILSTIAILSLILFSACSQTEELPFKVGDTIWLSGRGYLTIGEKVVVLEIKGKWFRAKDPKEDSTSKGWDGIKWYNSATLDNWHIAK